MRVGVTSGKPWTTVQICRLPYPLPVQTPGPWYRHASTSVGWKPKTGCRRFLYSSRTKRLQQIEVKEVEALQTWLELAASDCEPVVCGEEPLDEPAWEQKVRLKLKTYT